MGETTPSDVHVTILAVARRLASVIDAVENVPGGLAKPNPCIRSHTPCADVPAR